MHTHHPSDIPRAPWESATTVGVAVAALDRNMPPYPPGGWAPVGGGGAEVEDGGKERADGPPEVPGSNGKHTR